MIKLGIIKVNIQLVVETRMWSIKVLYLILITFLFRKHATLVNRDMKKPTENQCYNNKNGKTLLGENRYFRCRNRGYIMGICHEALWKNFVH